MTTLKVIGIVVIALAILYGRFYRVIEAVRRRLRKNK
jgi:hypothetical protein